MTETGNYTPAINQLGAAINELEAIGGNTIAGKEVNTMVDPFKQIFVECQQAAQQTDYLKKLEEEKKRVEGEMDKQTYKGLTPEQQEEERKRRKSLVGTFWGFAQEAFKTYGNKLGIPELIYEIYKNWFGYISAGYVHIDKETGAIVPMRGDITGYTFRVYVQSLGADLPFGTIQSIPSKLWRKDNGIAQLKIIIRVTGPTKESKITVEYGKRDQRKGGGILGFKPPGERTATQVYEAVWTLDTSNAEESDVFYFELEVYSDNEKLGSAKAAFHLGK